MKQKQRQEEDSHKLVTKLQQANLVDERAMFTFSGKLFKLED